MGKKLDPAIIVAIPIVAVIGGGYLSLPVTSLTRGKEPWTSISLLILFALVLWLVGTYAVSAPLKTILWVWAGGSAFYLIMVAVGGFRQHVEPFFIAHMMAFLCLMGLTAISNKKQNEASLQHLPHREFNRSSLFHPHPRVESRPFRAQRETEPHAFAGVLGFHPRLRNLAPSVLVRLTRRSFSSPSTPR